MTINGEAFARKALTWVAGIVGLLLATFFIWLAATVIDIQGRVIAIEATAKSLSDARDREMQNVGARNAARIDRLEGTEKDGQ